MSHTEPSQNRINILDAIAHTPPQRVPWQMNMTAGFAEKVRRETGCDDPEAFAENHITLHKYKQNKKIAPNKEVDIFGVTWVKGDDGGDIGVICDHPIKAPTLDSYHFPEIRKAFAIEQCEKLQAVKNNGLTFFGLTMTFFERAWSLRGMEHLLMDMIAEESFCFELFEKIEEHHNALLDIVLDYDFDGVYFGDDYGQQHGLIMGPPLFRKYIKPGMSRLIEKIKSRGKLLCLHSCGDLRDIFPDVIDMGVDIYNTLQPEIYDLPDMKRQYGQDITFYGGISTQQFLPFAKPEEVREQTRRIIGTLGESGGYILSPTHALTPDIPVANMIAMIDAARETQR